MSVLGSARYVGQCRECNFKLGPVPYVCAVDQANAHGSETGHLVFVVLVCRECGGLVEGVCEHARMERAREREVR